MPRIDLNQLRAARAEQAREPYVIVVGDPPEEFTIPHEMDWPVEFHEFLGEGSLRRAMQVLFGAQWDKLKAHALTNGDLQDMLDAILAATGTPDVGEASGSSGSSPNGSPPSSQTSNGSTPSTSAKRSPQAKAASASAASTT